MPASTVLLLFISVVLAMALVFTLRHLNALQARSTEPEADAVQLRAQLDATLVDVSRQSAVLDTAPLGVVVIDPNGQTIHSNRIASRYSSPSGDEAVIGVRLRDLIAAAVDSDGPLSNEVELFEPARTVRLEALPLLVSDNRVGTVVFVEDMTTRSRIDMMRSDFIANASHELKTPIGALQLLAEALVASDDAQVRQKLGQRVQDESARMTRLIEDILDLSLIEGDHQEYRSVNLCDVVAAAKEQTELLADTLEVPVHHSCIPVSVSGDLRGLVSALANLVENAIAYTKAKSVHDPAAVQIRAFPDDEVAVMEVEDKGIGIADRHLDRIFERFYRVDRGRSRTSGGTGLGLAIVSHIVQNHGGKVHVESVPGTGSTFRIELPKQGMTSGAGN